MADDHNQQLARLQSEITALQQAIASLAALPDTQQPLKAQLTDKEQQLAQLQTGGVNLGQGNAIGQTGDIIAGNKFGGDQVLRDKIINQFFAGQPPEDGKHLLRDYLAKLLEDNAPLRLKIMTERRQSGSGQDLLPPLKLADVFTSLTTERWLVGTRWHQRPKAPTMRLAERLARRDRSFDAVPPEHVRELWIDESEGFQKRTHTIRLAPASTQEMFQHYAEDTVLRFGLARPELVLEAIATTPRLVVLGAPGSGKSTALRYLALLLAQHLLDPDRSPLPISWNDAPIPILCPLGLVASALARAKLEQSDAEVLWQVLEAQLDGEGGLRQGLGRHLRPALRSGAALLLLDGLDEISATPGPDGRSLRTRVSRAVQVATRELPQATRVVLTCRVLPYQQRPATPRDDWHLSNDHWTVRTVQPFAFGQVRRFVTSWYDAACRTPAAIYDPESGAARAASLLEQLDQNQRLHALTASPLTLTMLAILHYNKETGELPRDRARLYDECVQLLLERWEPVRTPEGATPGLLERLGIEQLANTDDIRTVMHTVALAAHDRPPDPADRRGLLRGSELEGEMSRLLRRLRCDRIDERLQAFEAALRDQIGLLQEEGDDTYAFPHLTFQEYLAACALADDPKMVEKTLAFWRGRDGDRWREVILLLMGRLRQQGKVELQGMQWLRALLKPMVGIQVTRDALLAADCYAEWGGGAALGSFDSDEVEAFERKLAQALAPLLADAGTALEERLRAGRHLTELGDPRPGVCSLAPDWCLVPAGPFLLGSTDQAGKADNMEKPQEKPQRTVDLLGFRISRYPVTIAQWRVFVKAGGYRERRWWNEAGWQVKEKHGWSQPDDWDNPRFNGANQPVVGISRYEATAFCCWLSSELGYEIRLPSEAEWEKSARGTDGRIYPWGNEWDETKVNTKESGIGASTPVGCFPNGASPYDVLDMSGNVFEWTATPWTNDYAQSDGTVRETEDGKRSVYRGGAWSIDRRYARCASRLYDFVSPTFRNNMFGVRIVAALTQDD